MQIDSFSSGLLNEVWAEAVVVEIRRTGDARYDLTISGSGGITTIRIWTTRKRRIRAECWNPRPRWVTLLIGPQSELESLIVERCGFHLEHCDRNRYILGFSRYDECPWYMGISTDAHGYIQTRVAGVRACSADEQHKAAP
jgi:hypothetical protein